MKKLFISQPMNNLTDDEIRTERDKIIREAMETMNDNIEIVDSFISEFPAKSIQQVSVWYLGMSLIKLAEADCAWFGDGWKDARGCKIEHTIAEEYGITILHD